jgi:hypothetical protein
VGENDRLRSIESGVGFTTTGNPLSSPVQAGAYSSYGGLVGGPFQSITVEGAKGIKDSNYAMFGLGVVLAAELRSQMLQRFHNSKERT